MMMREGTVVVEFTLANLGHRGMEAINLTVVPGEFSIVSDWTAEQCSGNTCRFGYLAAGQRVDGEIRITPFETATELDIVVEVWSVDPDSDPDNNRDSVKLVLPRIVEVAAGTLKWSRHFRDATIAAVDGDNLYLVSGHWSSEVTVYAVDKEKGDVVWHHELNVSLLPRPEGHTGSYGAWSGEIRVGPFPWGEMVFVGYAPRNLDALDRSTGRLMWRFELENYGTPYPVFSGEDVYLTTDTQGELGADKGIIFSLELETGKVNWESELEDYGWFLHGKPVVVANGSVYFSYVEDGSGNSIYAMDASNGELRWRYDIWGDSLVADDDRVYFQGGAGVSALGAESGRLDWQLSVDTAGRVPRLALAQNRIYFCAAGSIYSIDASSGELLWKHGLESECPWDDVNVPVVDGEWVFFGTSDPGGALFSFDAGSGELLWKRESRQAAEVLSVAADGMVYFFLDGNLNAARSATGEVVWTEHMEEYDVSSIIVSEGIVFASTEERVVAVHGHGDADSW